MTDFKNYMKMNVYYEYLEKYYKSEDIASIHGVDKFEIKHSNVLKWILEPKGDEAIDYLPIRNLLKLVQKNNKYYDFFNEIDLNTCFIENVKFQREKYYIDLLVTFKIDNENYMMVIENKLESFIHDNQLEVYKNEVNELYKSYKKLFVFLHPGYQINSFQETAVAEAEYINITYQEIYDNILKSLVEFTADTKVKLIVDFYNHTLSCYDSDNLIGLIVTDEERKSLEALFKDSEILKMIDSLYNNEKSEYTTYYKEHKTTFIKIFNKYLHIIEDEILKGKIVKILKTKSYILNGSSYNGIANLLQEMFEFLLIYNTIDELSELIYLSSETDPLLVPETDLLKVEHKNWYLSNPKIITYNGVKYYVLSSWASKEYDILKDNVNTLFSNTNIKGSIVME